MFNSKKNQKELLIKYIKFSNSINSWLIKEFEVWKFIKIILFCLENNIIFSEKEFIEVFNNTKDYLWNNFNEKTLKRLYKKYLEYKDLFRALDEY